MTKINNTLILSLFDGMSGGQQAINSVSSQIQEDSSQIAKIKREGKSKIRKFEKWLGAEAIKQYGWEDEMAAAKKLALSLGMSID